jgi:branched-subunit amino acid aminotransferase/4-amino-4-deoxychorismate lyase
MLQHVYLNGRFVDRGSAGLPLSDLSILRGYGAFDYFRYRKRQPRFLSDHLDRFYASAAGLNLNMPLPREDLANIIRESIDRNGATEGGIRTVITGGPAEDGYTPTAPSLLVLPYAFQPPPPAMYRTGCSVMLHRYERQLPRVKTIDYIEGIRIQPLLRKVGADFPLYVDRDDRVRESDRSNFMIVRDGTLLTPVDDILLGITRKHVLRLARSLGIPVRERAVSRHEVRGADEALICSSVKGVMPITRIDAAEVGGGDAGAITTRLMDAWPGYCQA